MPPASNILPDWPALAHAFGKAADAGELNAFRRRRWGTADAEQWLEQDALTGLSETQAVALYRGAGGRQLSKFRTNPIDEVRDAVDFLLYDSIKLENRFEECAVETGGFGLAGAGHDGRS